MDLSVLIPTYNEEGNIGDLVKEIKNVVEKLGISYEIIVADGQSKDKTVEEAKDAGAKVFVRSELPFRAAFKEGFPKCEGEFILTIDADFSHNPKYITELWKSRNDADVIVCSRYVSGGGGEMTTFRRNLSIFFNTVYIKLLSLRATDLNCNYRLYHREVVKKIKLNGKESDVIPELLCKAILAGYRVKDIPFFYEPRKHGKSTLKFFRYGWLYGKLLLRLLMYRLKIIRLEHSVSAR
jgi:dolichol-phosphate mannosyltransferase